MWTCRVTAALFRHRSFNTEQEAVLWSAIHQRQRSSAFLGYHVYCFHLKTVFFCENMGFYFYSQSDTVFKLNVFHAQSCTSVCTCWPRKGIFKTIAVFLKAEVSEVPTAQQRRSSWSSAGVTVHGTNTGVQSTLMVSQVCVTSGVKTHTPPVALCSSSVRTADQGHKNKCSLFILTQAHLVLLH